MRKRGFAIRGLNTCQIEFGQFLKGYNIRANNAGHPQLKWGNYAPECSCQIVKKIMSKLNGEILISLDLLAFRHYILNEIVNIRESRRFEFKTGGGAYPTQILPEVSSENYEISTTCNRGIWLFSVSRKLAISLFQHLNQDIIFNFSFPFY